MSILGLTIGLFEKEGRNKSALPYYDLVRLHLTNVMHRLLDYCFTPPMIEEDTLD